PLPPHAALPLSRHPQQAGLRHGDPLATRGAGAPEPVVAGQDPKRADTDRDAGGAEAARARAPQVQYPRSRRRQGPPPRPSQATRQPAGRAQTEKAEAQDRPRRFGKAPAPASVAVTLVARCRRVWGCGPMLVFISTSVKTEGPLMKSLLASMALVFAFCAAPAMAAEFPKSGEAEYDTYYVYSTAAKIDSGAGLGLILDVT